MWWVASSWERVAFGLDPQVRIGAQGRIVLGPRVKHEDNSLAMRLTQLISTAVEFVFSISARVGRVPLPLFKRGRLGGGVALRKLRTLIMLIALTAISTTAHADELVAYEIVEDAISAPLTDQAGDPAAGREAFIDRDRGHCLLCHTVSSIEAPFHGTIGLDLSDVGSALTPGQLRLRVVDQTRLIPDTVMPAYFRVERLNQVAPEYAGKPILTAQEVEDVVAYLESLKEGPE